MEGIDQRMGKGVWARRGHKKSRIPGARLESAKKGYQKQFSVQQIRSPVFLSFHNGRLEYHVLNAAAPQLESPAHWAGNSSWAFVRLS